jgi:hypothetical protein
MFDNRHLIVERIHIESGSQPIHHLIEQCPGELNRPLSKRSEVAHAQLPVRPRNRLSTVAPPDSETRAVCTAEGAAISS